eukprot:TRINITY_DN3168_c0_g1_i1.p1 TRINITY_DN3168_c0_g1~~TRINITY_DN3168_c0_g1_i1.p1  ORF type:complete len:205 (+),score=27.37 TRINITY_DN3168_c0_g1_i1:95-709(+)
METPGATFKKQKVDGTAPGEGIAGDQKDLKKDPPNRNTKPCTKFFSVSGCPYGENCHFMHSLPTNLQAVSVPTARPRQSALGQDGSSSQGFKTRLCNKFATPEGCKFGDKCHFAHGEHDLRAANRTSGSLGGEYPGSAPHAAISKYGSAPTPWTPAPTNKTGSLGSHNYKTKLCEKFNAGSCMFGEKCHFAHGQKELRTRTPAF